MANADFITTIYTQSSVFLNKVLFSLLFIKLEINKKLKTITARHLKMLSNKLLGKLKVIENKYFVHKILCNFYLIFFLILILRLLLATTLSTKVISVNN